MTRPGFELMISTSEVDCANHYSIGPLLENQQIYLCNILCDETKSESWPVQILVSVLPEQSQNHLTLGPGINIFYGKNVGGFLKILKIRNLIHFCSNVGTNYGVCISKQNSQLQITVLYLQSCFVQFAESVRPVSFDFSLFCVHEKLHQHLFIHL